MSLRSKTVTAGAVGVLTIGSALLSATGANASVIQHGTSAPTHTVHANPARPNIDTGFLWTYKQTGYGGDSWGYECAAGQEYPIELLPVESAMNNCEYRVYLQYSNGTSFCINPHSGRKDIGQQYRDPDSVFIGDSTSSC